MKVNIIHPEDGWILENLARKLNSGLEYTTLNSTQDTYNKFDINYYINYLKFKKKTKANDVVWFTHLDEDDEKHYSHFFWSLKHCNYCICHAKQYENLIRQEGQENVTTIQPGVDFDFFKPKLKLGFVGRFSHYGYRKGRDLLDKVAELDFVDVISTEGKVLEQELPDFYQTLDYVIVTSKYEGGPMCLVEGLASGIPVIIPDDVGVAPELERGLLKYKNSDFDSLHKLLLNLYEKKTSLREEINHMTWSNFIQEHDKLFRSLV